MILLPDIALPARAAADLQATQAEVNASPDYASRVSEAHRLFSLRNRRGNATFDAVKDTLDRMCAGARRCAYCEDSLADEVEHVRPKTLYPQYAFAWRNFVYACGPCNGPKSSRFAVFIEGNPSPVEIARTPGDPIVAPLEGDIALIDPRIEDATKLLFLELRETHLFVPLAKKGSRDHARADYTIRTLGLNRDVLARSRQEAHKDYVAHLRHYQHEREAGARPERLAELRQGIQRRQHPTVWREMQRQHELPLLRPLFAAVPEAREW